MSLQNIPRSTKLCIFNMYIKTILIYGCETLPRTLLINSKLLITAIYEELCLFTIQTESLIKACEEIQGKKRLA